MKRAFKSGYKDGKKKPKNIIVFGKKRGGGITAKKKKTVVMSRKTSSNFRSEMTGKSRKGNLAGKVGAVAGVNAGRLSRRASNVKKSAYKMTAKHKAAISKALKGRKRK